MAQLLPDKERQRPLAWLLLVVAVILFYYAFVQRHVQRHLEVSEAISQMQGSEARYRAAIAQRPVLEERIAEARRNQSESDLFLQQANANLAASELTTRLKDVISNFADNPDNCTVLSQQNIRSPEEEEFERVTIKARMRCEVSDLAQVLYQLENGIPYVFVDNVTIYRQVTRRRRGRELVQEKMLDVRFDMAGYLRGDRS
ncbi:MAG: type II secretion system protein GspM [Pseudomonadota bacterium]